MSTVTYHHLSDSGTRSTASVIDRIAIAIGTSLAGWGRAHAERVVGSAEHRAAAERAYGQRMLTAGRALNGQQSVRTTSIR